MIAGDVKSKNGSTIVASGKQNYLHSLINVEQLVVLLSVWI